MARAILPSMLIVSLSMRDTAAVLQSPAELAAELAARDSYQLIHFTSCSIEKKNDMCGCTGRVDLIH